MTSSGSPTAPAPSTFAPLTTIDTWLPRPRSPNSRTSSTVTIRSNESHSASSAFSSVVLPLPVPPLISTRARFFTRFLSNVNQSGGNIPASRNPVNPSNRRSGKRIVTAAPCATSGAITACTRIPSSLDASGQSAGVVKTPSQLRTQPHRIFTHYSRRAQRHRQPALRHSSASVRPHPSLAGDRDIGDRWIACQRIQRPKSIMGHHLPTPSRWHRRLHPPPCGCSCR